MNKYFGGFLNGVALSTVLAASSAVADTVSIFSLGGTMQLTGDLIDFDGENYTLETSVGRLIVPAENALCRGDSCPQVSERSVFTFAGTRSLADNLIPALITNYAERINLPVQVSSASGLSQFDIGTAAEPIARVAVKGSSSRDGFASLENGYATFTMASRQPSAREVISIQDAGKGNVVDDQNHQILAINGLLLVTHPSNPVRAITEMEVAQAFAGQITNWSVLNGFDSPITLYAHAQSGGTRESFEALVMSRFGLSISANIIELPTEEAVAEAVKSDVNGLGLASVAQLEASKVLDIEGVCGLRTPATSFTIKTQEYPLSHFMYLYKSESGKLDTISKGFLDFLTTEETQESVATAGFVNQSISSTTINSQGIRVASTIVNNANDEKFESTQRMLELFMNSDRLSATFRFDTETAQPDERAVEDAKRLASLLGNDEFTNREVLFVGFTDSVGRDDLNLFISLQQSDMIRGLVTSANPELKNERKLSALGYGEASPLGCNETEVGRQTNRRVEVWVRDIVKRD